MAHEGLLTFDYDEDGDLDVLVVNNVTGAILFRNDGGNANDWLQVEVLGRRSTKSGWGARIEVQAASGGATQLRVVGARSHFLGQSERIAHFGLGAPSAQGVHRVTVRFPGGPRVELENVPRNARILVQEPIPVPALAPWARGLLAAVLCGVLLLRRRAAVPRPLQT